jgi:hypothetical protein
MEHSSSVHKTFATTMLSHCTKNHSACRPEEPLWSPKRLIEIVPSPHGYKLRLVTDRPLEPYIALSHCWGSVHVFKLSSQNLEEMQTNIEILQLPKTFQDAISITTWFNGSYTPSSASGASG